MAFLQCCCCCRSVFVLFIFTLNIILQRKLNLHSYFVHGMSVKGIIHVSRCVICCFVNLYKMNFKSVLKLSIISFSESSPLVPASVVTHGLHRLYYPSNIKKFSNPSVLKS